MDYLTLYIGQMTPIEIATYYTRLANVELMIYTSFHFKVN